MPKKQLLIKLEDTPEAADLLAAFDEKARRAGFSRQGYVVELMRRDVGGFDPGIKLGYVELVNSELDADDDCPECLTPFGSGGIWIGFTAVGHFGPVCRRCALG